MNRFHDPPVTLRLPNLIQQFNAFTDDLLQRQLWQQKIRVPGLSYGVVWVILRTAALVQCPSVRLFVTSRQT